jgi:hypothetical protein
MSSASNFVQQQGFPKAEPSSCGLQFSALMFQPRLIGILVAIGIVTQSAGLFLTLAALLTWCALVPKWNPFEVLHRVLIARPRGTPPLGPTPAPRRFAQGMAATFMLGIGLSLLGGQAMLAWILEGVLAVALAALVVGRFCLGSYLFHLFTGNRLFANATLPWRRS